MRINRARCSLWWPGVGTHTHSYSSFRACYQLLLHMHDMMSYSSCMHTCPSESLMDLQCAAVRCRPVHARSRSPSSSSPLLHEAKLLGGGARLNQVGPAPAGPRCTKRGSTGSPFALHPRSFRIGVTACVIFFRPRSYHPYQHDAYALACTSARCTCIDLHLIPHASVISRSLLLVTGFI